MPSLIDTWHPIAHDIGFIQAPIGRLVAEFEAWQSSFGTRYRRTEIASSLGDAFASLLPLAQSRQRRLFVPTRSDWVACFQNGIQGSDPFPAMSYLAGRMGVLAMRACCAPDGAQHPATIWEVYAPQSLGGDPLCCRRSIAAANDGGRWAFGEAGERYAFELAERYAERRKQDRFTREMLREYARQFGIELFSDEFLRVDASAPAVRLQQVTNLHATPEFTLEQVVAGVPWQRRG